LICWLSIQKIATASKVTSGKAHLAIDLVGYEDEVERAMEFVFGNTFVCPDAESAKKVTFHNDIRLRSVTLEGDVYDPSGTLSGGSKPTSSGVLVKVQELKEIERELVAKERALASASADWEKARGQIDKFKAAKQALDLKSHEVHLLEERVKESNATRVCCCSSRREPEFMDY
jgi:structural maintenance of chromosome 2